MTGRRRFASHAPYVDTNPEWLPHQWIATDGASLIGVGVALWLLDVVRSVRTGTHVTNADAWDLKRSGQFTREWAWFERKPEDRPDDPVAELRDDDEY